VLWNKHYWRLHRENIWASTDDRRLAGFC
jgi:hypothetical protein